MFLRPIRTYAAAGLGSAVLVAGLTLVAPSAHAAMVPTPDDAAVAWLTQQLGSDDLINGDLGATIDFGTALAQIGGPTATIDRIRTVVDAGVTSYASSGLAAAQSAVFYETIGDDPTMHGDNLIAKVSAAIDSNTGVLPESGYEGGWSQGLVVRALEAVHDANAAKALAGLLSLEQSDGGWASGSGSTPDDTADALFALVPLAGTSTEVDDAIASGVAWLQTNQTASGAWLAFGEPSGNSTGLAAQAMALAGQTASVTKAARWLRHLQIAGTPCDGKLSGQAGAVAAKDSVIANGRTDGLTDPYGYDWYQATIQSFPALGYAPESSVGHSISAPRWAKARSTVAVTANGLAPNERGCLSLVGKNVAVLGGTNKAGSFTFGAATRSHTAVLRILGASFTTKIVALAPKTFTVGRGRAVVTKGGLERITVSGLYPGEPVHISYRGSVVARGVASSTGTFVRSIAVGRTAGATTAYVAGRFGTRTGHVGFTVR